jgi:hypothetical protein
MRQYGKRARLWNFPRDAHRAAVFKRTGSRRYFKALCYFDEEAYLRVLQASDHIIKGGCKIVFLLNVQYTLLVFYEGAYSDIKRRLREAKILELTM